MLSDSFFHSIGSSKIYAIKKGYVLKEDNLKLSKKQHRKLGLKK